MTTKWRAPTVDREEPTRTGGERESLAQWLDFHRETLLMKCAGLSAEQLKAPAPTVGTVVARPGPPHGRSGAMVVPHVRRGRDREQVRNIRWIHLHMIEEYARHNGHADLIRECMDGAVGD
jgi:hypothetical protein